MELTNTPGSVESSASLTRAPPSLPHSHRITTTTATISGNLSTLLLRVPQVRRKLLTVLDSAGPAKSTLTPSALVRMMCTRPSALNNSLLLSFLKKTTVTGLLGVHLLSNTGMSTRSSALVTIPSTTPRWPTVSSILHTKQASSRPTPSHSKATLAIVGMPI